MEKCAYDPAREWDKHCERQEREAAGRQICDNCDSVIYDDYCYNINGDFICKDCLERDFMVETPVED